MTILESVGDFLASNGQGTLGTNLFLSLMPDTPDACVSVYEDEGGEPMVSLGGSGLQLDQPNIQVIVRGARDDYPGTRDKANAIRLLLGALTDQTISGVRILSMTPLGSVLPMGVDDKHRPMVSANFRCMVAL